MKLRPVRLVDAFWWLAPILFLLWLYWDGFSCWFIADDFAWLGLLRQYHSLHDLPRLLFEPAAQGTIRPWSERGFFLLFESLFGLDDLPFRIMAFATMAVNLILLAWITRRVTHSRIGGCLAGIVWASNPALMTVMTWSAAYNEALCPLFLLSAMALFIRYGETGQARFWWWQLVIFTLGFGALEINVVYPALAGAWALFMAPTAHRKRLLRSVVPLVAISILYFAIHTKAAPLPKSGEYTVHVDSRMFDSLLAYGRWSLLPIDWDAFGHSHRRGLLILWTGVAALVGLALLELWKRRRAALFFVVWYLATLAPMLPLPNHQSDYYLTIPLIGLGMLAGWAFSCAWRDFPGSTRAWQFAPAIAIAAYLCGTIPMAQSATRWFLDQSVPIRAVVLGVEAAHEKHPGKTILLDGVTKSIYENSMGQGAFYALGIDNVYLTSGSELTIRARSDVGEVGPMVLDPGVARHAIASDQLVIYSVAGDHLRNITEDWERSALSRLPDRIPNRVDVGNPLFSWLLGPQWLSPESGARWMPGRATVRLAGPESPGNKLVLEGYCPPAQLKAAPRHLIVTADGVSLGETQINDPESSFHRLFALPDSLLGRKSIEVEMRVDPVARIDGQEFGLIFGKISVQR